MAKLFSDIDDFLPGKGNSSEPSELATYLAEHAYFDGIQAPPDEKVLYYEGIPIGSRGNIIAINGKAKSRKSVIASAIMTSAYTEDPAGFLGFTVTLPHEARVLNFDTEQGLGHWIEGSRRVITDAGLSRRPEGFNSHYTRECDVEKRIELLKYSLKLYAPDIAVVDGITDLVYDLNSQEEATRIGGELMRLSVEFNCLIVAIIHITKGTGYMTGALGTYLEKKCQTAIKCEKDEKDDGISWVSCQYSRDKGFHAFGIQFDERARRYKRLDESEVQQTGKGSRNTPDTKTEEFRLQMFNRTFGPNSGIPTVHALKIAINEAGKASGVGKFSRDDLAAWMDYFLTNNLIVPHPSFGYVKGEFLAAYKKHAPEMDFQTPDNPVENLPDDSADLPF